MKQKGFTLTEMIGVVVLLGLLAIVSLPPILNQIKKSKNTLSEATLKILSTAAEQHVDEHPTNYPIKDGNVYCITLKTLTDYGYLKSPILDASSGDEINEEENSIKFTINSFNNYNTELVKTSECTENRQ